MAGVNKVILVGNLGKDPEIQHFEGGSVKATFSLATTESYKKDGQRIDQTEWHNIVVWRGLAEIAHKYLKKGSMVYIEGKLRTRSWDDKETNAKRYITEIVADNMTMLGGKPAGGETGNRQAGNAMSDNVSNFNDETDDLPF